MTEGKGLEWHENLREKQRILGHSSTAVLGCAPAGPEPLAAFNRTRLGFFCNGNLKIQGTGLDVQILHIQGVFFDEFAP